MVYSGSILSVLLIFVVLISIESKDPVYICPAITMYPMPNDDVKQCPFWEGLVNTVLCNATNPCKGAEMKCCPSNVGRVCGTHCITHDIRGDHVGYCSRPIYDTTRNCSMARNGFNKCNEDGNCHDPSNKCCLDECGVLACIASDTEDKCLKPVEQITCSGVERDHAPFYYYKPMVSTWGTIRGACLKSNSSCLGTANKFESLSACERTCAKRGCELLTCVHPTYGVNTTRYRKQQCPEHGFSFDVNGCVACSCALKSACEGVQCFDNTICEVKISDCPYDICPRKGVCISFARALQPMTTAVLILLTAVYAMTTSS